jgi:hypothetical protein
MLLLVVLGGERLFSMGAHRGDSQERVKSGFLQFVPSPITMGAQVYTGGTDREDMRAEIQKSLHGKTGVVKEEPRVEEQVVPNAVEKPVVTIPPHTGLTEKPTPDLLYACSNVVSHSGKSGALFGNGVVITLAEGARLYTATVNLGEVSEKHVLQFPEHPVVGNSPHCILRGIVGVTLDGMYIFGGEEITETAPTVASHSTLVGYAMDGFGIFGAEEDGHTMTNTDLDACHGHTSTIVWDGVPTSMYHYHRTSEYPYTVGCFKGGVVVDGY